MSERRSPRAEALAPQFAAIERRIVDYFEANGCDVEQDGIEWKLSLYDEGPSISLTGLAVALWKDAE